MTTFWAEAANANAWIEGDTQTDLLAVPRRIAAEIVAQDRPDVLRIADIGSGTGVFLSAFLDRFPDALALWTDVSETMRTSAREALAGYGDRVHYEIMDIHDLRALPDNLDVVMTSRCAHHLDPQELAEFYAAAGSHLSPGGWLINLDHVRRDATWDARLRAARSALLPPRPGRSTHHHDRPLPTSEEHLDALGRAGFADVEIGWQAFVTQLFLARRPG
jgi:trans-aconitate methyltransferase